MITLKPVDIAVAIKVGLNNMYSAGNHPAKTFEYHDYLNLEWHEEPIGNSVEELSRVLDLSAREVAYSLKRLVALNMLTLVSEEGDPKYVFYVEAMSQFLCHSLRHVMLPETFGAKLAGVPTGWDCPWANSEMNPPSIPWVWPDENGPVVGIGVEPLYPGVVHAVRHEPGLYRALALIDPIRIGKPRDCIHARRNLVEWLAKLRP